LCPCFASGFGGPSLLSWLLWIILLGSVVTCHTPFHKSFLCWL
jgi:hypothetical protein